MLVQVLSSIIEFFIITQALLVDKHGRVSVVNGPQRVSVWRKSFQRLARVSADQKQYIRVQYSNGNIEHIHGYGEVAMVAQ